MKYPGFIKKLNNVCGFITGFIIFAIMLILIYETISRSIFRSPNTWSLPLTQYLILWGAFIGSGYAFQEKGHVGVGFIRDIIGKIFGKAVKRFLAVVSYLCCVFYLVILVYQTTLAFGFAQRIGRLTPLAWQIPITWLYAGIILGSVLMIATLLFIVADLLAKNDHYLEI